MKRLNYTVDERRYFKETSRLLEQGGCHGFCKIQVAMPRIMQPRKK